MITPSVPRIGVALGETQVANAEYPVMASREWAKFFDELVRRVIARIDVTDDIIIDLATKGFVLKDTQTVPHYWRVTVDTTGALVTSDLGTSKP